MTEIDQRLSTLESQIEAKSQELSEAQRIAKIGFWRWNLETNAFTWSEEIYRLLKLDPEEFVVTLDSTLSCIHPDDRGATMSKLLDTVSEAQGKNHEYRVLSSDGRVLHFWSNTQLVVGESGEPVEVRGICQDVTERVLAENALSESEDHYRHAIQLNPQIPWTSDPQGNILEVGPRWFDLIGIPEQQALGQGWLAALHPDDYDATLTAWCKSVTSGIPLDIEYRLRLRAGDYNWMRARATARRSTEGAILRWYGTVEDIHAYKSAQLALLASEAKLSSVLASTSDSIILVDSKWRIEFLNGRASEALKGMPRVASGMNLVDAFPELIGSKLHTELLAAQSDRRAMEVEAFVSRLGLWLEVRAFPTGDGMSIFFRDVTEERRVREQVTYLAHHDPLTGLANRALFVQRLHETLETADASGEPVGLIYLDLDDFKIINDTFGHDAGDAVLIAAARRLEETVPLGSFVGRLGGDELAVIVTNPVDADSLERVSGHIRAALSEPVPYASTELSCKVSMGIAIYPLNDHRPSELLKNADLALYTAKRAGGNQHAFFSPDARQVMQQRLSALACARDALARDAIIPFYQPKVSMETGMICGFEALLRWAGPRSGINPPGMIKEAFEDPILSVELGKRMLERVVADMAAWQRDGVDFGHVAINVSSQELVRTPVADNVLNALRAAGLPASTLEIEVTETVFLGDGSDGVGDTLRKLHDNGVSIALDDFGTGYASLTHLSKFPVDWLKIDQSFIRELGENPDATAIVKAVIGLSRNLGIQVVAEGVETFDQWRELKRRGCDLAQGYLIAKPMSADRVPYLMSTWIGFGRPNRGRSRGLAR